MEYNLFIQQVRTRARLRSQQAAVAATSATIITLVERLGSIRLAELAHQLPAVIGPVLATQASLAPEIFTFDGFCQRLADREQTDVPTAVFRARCVIETLREMSLPTAVDALAADLPRDFAPLFRGVSELRPAA